MALSRQNVALHLAIAACVLAGLGCQRRAAPGTSGQKAEKAAEADSGTSLYALTVDSLDGKRVKLSAYRGQVVLLVNVASECGYTPQYGGLQRVYEKYRSRGFVVLGFPSNDFGEQEPGSSEQIRQFCSSKYRVTFPMFQKVQIKPGPGQSQVYGLLGRASGRLPSWNFGKYLVGRSGEVLELFNSDTDPEATEVVSAIEAALGKG